RTGFRFIRRIRQKRFRKVAGGEMSGDDFPESGLIYLANVPGDRAACVKRATRRWIGWTGQIALQDYAFAAVVARIGNGSGADKSLRVRMKRCRINFFA